MFPTICVDNFYDDPEYVEQFALSQDFCENEPTYPGKRTKEIYEINPKLYQSFCEKLMSLYYDISSTNINWVISTRFQLVEQFHEDRDSIKNKGWIHQDTGVLFGGVIYLNKNPIPETGTSVFSLIANTHPQNNNPQKLKFHFAGIDDEYDRSLEEHNSHYIETIRFNNVYNRLISFDSSTPHGVNSYYTNGNIRLTQVFFVYKIDKDSPLQRMRNIKEMR